MSTRPWPRRRGLSLVETLLILAIVLLAITLLVPVVQRVQSNASRKECAHHLQQIVLAIHCYHDHKKCLPPSRLADNHAAWPVLLLPFFGQDSLAKKWDLHKTYYEQTAEARLSGLGAFFCPARRYPPQISATIDAEFPGTLGDYAGCAGDRLSATGCLDGEQATGSMINAKAVYCDSLLKSWTSRLTLADLKDGLSSCLLVGDRHVPTEQFGTHEGDGPFYNGHWPQTLVRLAGPGPAGAAYSYGLARGPADQEGPSAASLRWQHIFGSAHPGICQFVAADGSVRALAVDTDPAVLQRLVVRDDKRFLQFGDSRE